MCFFFSLNGKFLMLAGWPILGALSRLQEGALDSVEGRAFDSVTGTGALIVERGLESAWRFFFTKQNVERAQGFNQREILNVARLFDSVRGAGA